MDLIRITVALAIIGCSGKTKGTAIEDARRPAPDAAPAVPPAIVRGYRVDTTVKTGDVSIRVEWKDVPPALRAPGPATACGGARPAAVAPTTLWGVPDVFVAVDVDHGKAFEPPASRIVVEDCRFMPRAVVAGASITVASALLEPATITLSTLARPLGGAAESIDASPRAIYLPITGHAIEAALDGNTVYAITLGTDDVAAVVAATTPYVGVTEPSGGLVLRDVPVGTHPVRAYLPARNGGPARTATGTVTVTAGALAEITLDIGRP